MVKQFFGIVTFLVGNLCLSGCGLTPLQTLDDTPTNHNESLPPDLSALESQLKMAADSVSASLRTLAKTQEAAAARANLLDTRPLVTAQGGMGEIAMLDWSGPIEPLLYKIASMTNYQLKILGNPPPIPVLVSIEGQNRVIADILKDAGLQATKQAGIVVYPELRIIELRYHT